MNYHVKTAVTLFICYFTLSISAQEIVAHRGASFEAPENTITAIKLAWEKNADAIEADFYLTKDKQIVCIHDRDTKRTAGVKISVPGSTLAQLQKLDVGSWKHKKYAGEKMPTLKDILDTLPPNKKFLIEIKSGPEIVPTLIPLLKKYKSIHPRLRIICFNSKVVAQCKKELPNIKAYWLTSYKQDKKTGLHTPDFNTVLKTLKTIKADGLGSHANTTVLTQSYVKQIKNLGYDFYVWTVNDTKIAQQMKSLGVDSIITDKPKIIRSAITPQKN